jgi:DNA-binding NarL/FixJ family response regulator
MEPVIVVIEDLFFLSKVQQTAQQSGVTLEGVEISKLAERLRQSPGRAVILDLNHRSGIAVETARAVKSDPATASVEILGFLSHVQADLAREARQAGCDAVLARSAFAQDLSAWLLKLAAR